jgi:hypothetical protein
VTTTERNCAAVSHYNEPYASPSGAAFRSFHYLDAAAGTLTTFWGMRTYSGGREYAGVEITSPLMPSSSEAGPSSSSTPASTRS